MAVEVVDRDAIEASGAEDVADVLDQQTGVVVNRGLFGASVQLRGLNPEHVLILVDGQRVVGRKDGTFDLSRIPADSIERIEIVKGASSALYGSDAMGGVINIITRQSKQPIEGSLHARGGTLTTIDTTAGVGARGRRSGFRFDAGWHNNAAFRLDPESPQTNGNAVWQLQLSGAADTKPNPNLTLRASGSYALQDSTGVELGRSGPLGLRPTSGVELAPTGGIFDRRNVTEDGLIRATADWLFDEQSRFSNTVGVSIYRDQFLWDQRNAGAEDAYEDTRETLVQLTSQLDRVLGGHVLSVGAEGFLSALASPRLGEEGRGNRMRGGLYAQDEWKVLSGSAPLVVVPGVRADGDSWFGGTVAPKLGVRFDPVSNVTLRASAGNGWRAPEFRELLLRFANSAVGYTVEGNPDLRPERSLGANAGLEWVPAESWSISVSGWYDQLRDLIQIGTLEEGPTIRFGYVNVARARTRGLEGSLGMKPVHWLGIDLSTTITDAVDLDLQRPLEGRALLQGTAAIRVDVPVRRGPDLTARAVGFGPRPFYESDGGSEIRVDADPYALVDLKVRQPLDASDTITLFAGVENLLDAGDARYLQTAPRLFYGGLDARLARARDRRTSEISR
ncbi:MAG: TonB-dependent receptor [Myxococcales bacterium]|nr:TonB-dependent receptor [Myxococcales bacterium]